ncbi:MAG: valine--tRNA ligase [Candidatus Omnitrophota bacterium]
MMNEIPSRYNPKEAEDKWYKYWQDNNLFAAKSDPAKKPFCIVIPPPNVTGILHMGHALNNSYQDVLIRFNRMKGLMALWMPGTDHAGIATQNVVERQLAKEGLTRDEVGREKLIERLWAWKNEYGDTIIHQLKKLGCSCDWSRTRFTMDEGYTEAVKEAFVHLYNKGLIYQGNYIINWCPRCQTALSDEEAAHKDMEGKLYFIKYPLKLEEANSKKKDYVVVATTRPETMFGDTAVAVNLKDRRYRGLVGKTVILPLAERPIKIIADPTIDPEFGTGAVKVTPAHDPNDFEIALRHSLEFIKIMSPDGRMNKNAGAFSGMDRFEAREAILEELKERELLIKVASHKHAVGHCYRCHTVIEPYLSKQWFVKMAPLAESAIEAVKGGRIKFHPARWTKVYLNWMQNLKDWCISRQIWWGHRIPVYYCKNCQEAGKSQIQNSNGSTPLTIGIEQSRSAKSLFVQQVGQIPNSKQEPGIIVSKEKPLKCPECGSADIYQDEDVLDTWFSSWLWPFATFGWPFNTMRDERLPAGQAERKKDEEDLKYFYPTSVLVTAPEIIFFWVARMIMAGFEFMRDIPFSDVYIHGTVRDISGKKMSKSLGNIIDPLKIIDEFGADALRYSLISLTAVGQDIFLSQEKFQAGRNFANKIWNASRFVMMNLKNDAVGSDLCQIYRDSDLKLPERWILSRLYETIELVEKRLNNFRFNDAAKELYAFFWHDFCDWYVELAKFNIEDKFTQIILFKVLEKSLRMLHPFMPFITEELWQRLPGAKKSIMTESWPHLQKDLIDRSSDKKMELFFEITNSVRSLKKDLNIENALAIKLIISVPDSKTKNMLSELSAILVNLLKLDSFKLEIAGQKPYHAVSALISNFQVFIPLKGIVDFKKESERIIKQIEELKIQLNNINQRLKNKDFLKKAPREIVDKEHAKKEETNESIKKLKQLQDAFR